MRISSERQLGATSGRRRRWVCRAAALVSTLLLAEGALQAAFHLVPTFGRHMLAEWDPRGRQLLADPTLVLRGNPYWPEHDRWGFRNRRVPRRADVVALGDSQTYGTGAAADQSWPTVLGRQLDCTVYNMGLGGYCAVQARAWLDEALSLRPHTVIVAFYTGNDLYDAFTAVYEHQACPDLVDACLAPALRRLQAEGSLTEHIRDVHELPPVDPGPTRDATPAGGADSGAPAREWVSCHVCLYMLARAVKDRLFCVPSRALAVIAGDTASDWERVSRTARGLTDRRLVLDREGMRTIFTPRYRLACLDTSDPRIAEGYRLCLEALRQMRDRCAAHGIRFVVVHIPTKEAVFAPFVGPEEGRPSGFTDQVEAESEVHRACLDALARSGIAVVDTLPALRAAVEAGRQIYPASENGHPLAAGYAVIATSAAKALAAGSGRPPSP